jgi:hypothetical protein
MIEQAGISPARLTFAGREIPPEPEPWGPAAELRARGSFLFEPDLGLPLGPSMAAPLPRGLDAGGPVEVRIGSGLAVYYDRVRLGRIVDVPLTVHELEPAAAELRWRGVAAQRRRNDADPISPDYDDVVPSGPFTPLDEETTPEGSVMDYLFEADYRLVVFATGQEVAVDFDAASLPPLAPGLTRTWFLVSTGYARDGDPNTQPRPWVEGPLRFGEALDCRQPEADTPKP